MEVDKATNTSQSFTLGQTGYNSEINTVIQGNERTERGTDESTEPHLVQTEKIDKVDTYSTYLAQVAGSDIAMKQQFVKIVHIMKRLKSVKKKLRNIWVFKNAHIKVQICTSILLSQ